jgi:hypothetical protein
LLIYGITSCEEFDRPPGQGCTVRDLLPWLVAGSSS